MNDAATATAPTKEKKKKPARATSDEKPTVVTTKVIKTESVSVKSLEDNQVHVLVTGDADVSTIDETLDLSVAKQLLACLKALLGGRGSGKPRK